MCIRDRVKTIINDEGGQTIDPDAFALTIAGDPATSGVAVSVPANTALAINETVLAGYEFESIAGPGCPAALGGTITLNPGDDVTCTITNNDVPATLTLVKTIINDEGGQTIDPDAFALTIAGDPVTSGVAVSVPANTALAINETVLAGYEFESIAGPGCPAALGGTITLNPGDDVTCTITNNDIPATLTLVKTIINDEGGQTIDPDAFVHSPSLVILRRRVWL